MIPKDILMMDSEQLAQLVGTREFSVVTFVSQTDVSPAHVWSLLMKLCERGTLEHVGPYKFRIIRPKQEEKPPMRPLGPGGWRRLAAALRMPVRVFRPRGGAIFTNGGRA